MVRSLILAGALFGASAAWSQPSITQAEYFFDNAGTIEGAGTPISILDFGGSVAEALTGIDPSGLAPGQHVLYIRFLDDSAEWGDPVAQSFFVPTIEAMDTDNTIAAGEFYFDTDPGDGSGTTVSLPPPGSVSIFTTSQPARSMSGNRLFGFRTQDSFGEYSSPLVQSYFAAPLTSVLSNFSPIQSAEFFVDTDPGLDLASPLDQLLLDPFGIVAMHSTILSTRNLSQNFHSLSARAKDASGEYSLNLTQSLDLRDSDNDMFIDLLDDFPTDPFEFRDTDGDGIGNNSDPDIDGDGLDNAIDTDDDGDGLPDAYELANGLNPADHVDALLDPDEDGLITAIEFVIGTGPFNPDSDGDGVLDGLDPTPLFTGVIDEIPTPPGIDSGDQFGASVTINADLIAAGAPMDEGGGAVYPFFLRGGNPVGETKLSIPASFTGSLFGASVVINGNLLFVGAPGVALTGDVHLQGALYERIAGNWQLLTTLAGTNDNGLGQFGASAAMEGNLLVVGAPRDTEGEGSGSGAVYLLQRSGNSFQVLDKVKLATPGTGDRFGAAVAIANGRVAVGATSRVVNSATRGEITVYDIDQGQLVEIFNTTGSQSGSAASFGASMGMRGDLLVVGAPGENSDRGATYVYFIGTTLDERTRLVGSSTVAGDGFGRSVSFDGSNIVVGAPGFSAFGKHSHAAKGVITNGSVFHYSGTNFDQEDRIDPVAGEQQFGAAVALLADRIVVGAPSTANQGAVAVHRDTRLLFKSGFE